MLSGWIPNAVSEFLRISGQSESVHPYCCVIYISFVSDMGCSGRILAVEGDSDPTSELDPDPVTSSFRHLLEACQDQRAKCI